MTKTITVVCDTDKGIIYGSMEEAREAYFSKVGKINEASHEYACERLKRVFSFENLVNAIVNYDYNVFNTIKTNYHNYVSEQNEADFNDWLDRCIVDDIEVEV